MSIELYELGVVVCAVIGLAMLVVALLGGPIEIWRVKIPRRLTRNERLALCALCALVWAFGWFIWSVNQEPTPAGEAREEPVTEPVTEPEPAIETTRVRRFDRGTVNEHCQPPRDVRWTISAEEGWEIVVGTVEVDVTSVSSRSSYGSVENETSRSFDVVGRIVNNGECIEVLGNTVARDGRGSLSVTGSYTERRIDGGG